MYYNYVKVIGHPLFKSKFFVLDCKEHMLERIALERGIKLHYVKEYIKDDSPFILTYYKVSKKYEMALAEALEDMQRRIELLGYKGYEEECRQFTESAERARAIA